MKNVRINVKNLIRLIVILVIIIAALIFIVKGCRRGSGSGNADESGAANGTVEESIQALVERYYTARLTLNENALAEIYNTDSVMEIDIYKKMNDYINDVTGIRCYIRDGVDSGDYVVFVYSDLDLASFDITIPNVTPLYVKTADDGTLYIYPGDYSPSLMKYIYPIDVDEWIEDIAQDDEEIKKLLDDTSSQIKGIAAENAGFRELYKKITNTDDDDLYVPEPAVSGSESGTEETESAE